MSPAAERKSASWGHAPSRVETSPDTVSTAKARALEPAKSTRPVTVFKRQSWAVTSERLTGPEFVSTSTSWALPPRQWTAPDTVEAFTFTPLNPSQVHIPGKGGNTGGFHCKAIYLYIPLGVPAGELVQLGSDVLGDFHHQALLPVLQPAQGQQAAVPGNLQGAAGKGQGEHLPLFQGAAGVLCHRDHRALPHADLHGAAAPLNQQVLHRAAGWVPGGGIGVLPGGLFPGGQGAQPKPAGGAPHTQHTAQEQGPQQPRHTGEHPPLFHVSLPFSRPFKFSYI